MRGNSIYFLLLTSTRHFHQALTGRTGETHRQLPAASALASGYRAQFLEDVAYYHQRYTGLREALPADKYTGRPAEGVHSVGPQQDSTQRLFLPCPVIKQKFSQL